MSTYAAAPIECRIREETPADADAIGRVVAAAFLDAPHAGRTEHFIVAALRASGALAVSLVAEHGGGIVGHAAVSPVSISDGTRGWYGLGPVAVLPAVQRRRIGQRLVEAALHRLGRCDAAGCVVLGDPAYYRRFGFAPATGLVLPGFSAPYFQALAFGADVPAGVVDYDPAFGADGSGSP